MKFLELLLVISATISIIDLLHMFIVKTLNKELFDFIDAFGSYKTNYYLRYTIEKIIVFIDIVWIIYKLLLIYNVI